MTRQLDTSVFCNPCDNNSNGTRNCNPLRCPLLQMPPQHTITSFDQDSDTVRYFIMGGNDNNGQPAFQLNPNTGELATSVLISYEPGPRSYQLQVDLVDNGVKLPGIQRTSVVLSITIVNVNDPPLLVTPNVTGVPENSAIGSTVHTMLASDEDGHTVAYSIVGGNNNTGVYPPALPTTAFHLGLSTGVLSPASILNFELLPQYDVRVLLTDNGSPALSTAITLRVNILDRNDRWAGPFPVPQTRGGWEGEGPRALGAGVFCDRVVNRPHVRALRARPCPTGLNLRVRLRSPGTRPR